MMSGRFRTEYLSRHWTSNKLGNCLLASCHGAVGNLEHMLITCPGLSTVRSRMWEMIFSRMGKLLPLKNFAFQIYLSSPEVQLQFFMEPLACTDVNDMCNLYVQTIINIVYYCVRTYVYYIHREKQILLCSWPGDLTFKTRHNQNITAYRRTKKQQTNDIFIPGQLGTSIRYESSHEQTGRQFQSVQGLASTAPDYSAEVPGTEPGVVCTPVGGGQVSTLDCLGEVTDCGTVGGVAVVCRGGQISGFSERSHMGSLVNLSGRGSKVGVGCLGPVAQLSPFHTRLSSSSNPGTQ